MKKLKILLASILLLVSFSLSAQVAPEKKAKNLTNEMTKVLSLSKAESDAIYQIQLDRFKENQLILKEYSNDEETKKEKLKLLGNKVFNQVKDVLGPDRQKQWKEYKSNN